MEKYQKAGKCRGKMKLYYKCLRKFDIVYSIAIICQKLNAINCKVTSCITIDNVESGKTL